MYDDDELTHEIQLDLFRICQESLNNVMLHAEANSVNIMIRPEGSRIVLTITDDGRGFDPKHLSNSPGLENMHKITASINGELTIHSEPGRGTSICVSILQPVVMRRAAAG